MGSSGKLTKRVDEQVIAFEDLIRDALFGVTSRVSLLIGASVGRLGQSRFIPLQWRSEIRLTLDLRRIKYGALTFDNLTFYKNIKEGNKNGALY